MVSVSSNRLRDLPHDCVCEEDSKGNACLASSQPSRNAKNKENQRQRMERPKIQRRASPRRLYNNMGRTPSWRPSAPLPSTSNRSLSSNYHGGNNNTYNHNTTSSSSTTCTTNVITKVALFFTGFFMTSTMSVYMASYIKSQLLMHAAAASSTSTHTSLAINHLPPVPLPPQQQHAATMVHNGQEGDNMNRRVSQPLLRSHNHKPSPPETGNLDSAAIANNNNNPPSPNAQNGLLNPRHSHPPTSLNLTQVLQQPAVLDATTSWQRNRWHCLQHIRQRQDDVLFSQTKNILGSMDGAAVLVDPAYHANVGDHMISVAEQVYLQRHHLQPPPPNTESSSSSTEMRIPRIDECSYFQAGPWAEPCSDVLTRTTTTTTTDPKFAFWHGGGNWGDLWDTIHDVRTTSMTLLLQQNYTILGMPQSLYFQSPVKEQQNANDFRQAVAAGLGLSSSTTTTNNNNKNDDATLRRALQGRLILTWREEESLQRATQLYPYAQHVLMPDIAFQLGPYDAKRLRHNPDAPNRVDLLFFLRNDVESLYTAQRNRQSIRQLLLLQQSSARRFTFSIVDWEDRLDRFGSDDYYFTDTAIQLLDMGQVLICDRLHAAILAYLSGIPFVFVDQVSGKITKTFRVAMNDTDEMCSSSSSWQTAMWDRAENLEDAIRKATALWQHLQKEVVQ